MLCAVGCSTRRLFVRVLVTLCVLVIVMLVDAVASNVLVLFDLVLFLVREMKSTTTTTTTTENKARSDCVVACLLACVCVWQIRMLFVLHERDRIFDLMEAIERDAGWLAFFFRFTQSISSKSKIYLNE